MITLEACRLNAVGPDPDDDPDLAFLTERIRICVEVLLRELVNVLIGSLVREFGLAADDERVVAVRGIDDCNRHIGVCPHVAWLRPSFRGVDEDVPVVGVHPDDSLVRRPIRTEGW